jgi:RimJ/RimL family protein N-acetyltransferase
MRPDVVLTDGVVVLRRVSMHEADAWKAGEDEEQIRWFEQPGPAPMENVVNAIRSWQESWENDGPVRHFGIRLADTDALAGGVETRDLGEGRCNLSYVVFPEFRRRGLATRAARLALDYARREQGCDVAVIKLLPDNVASRRVAAALGASPAGHAPSDAGATFDVFEVDLDRLRPPSAF